MKQFNKQELEAVDKILEKAFPFEKIGARCYGKLWTLVHFYKQGRLELYYKDRFITQTFPIGYNLKKSEDKKELIASMLKKAGLLV